MLSIIKEKILKRRYSQAIRRFIYYGFVNQSRKLSVRKTVLFLCARDFFIQRGKGMGKSFGTGHSSKLVRERVDCNFEYFEYFYIMVLQRFCIVLQCTTTIISSNKVT